MSLTAADVLKMGGAFACQIAKRSSGGYPMGTVADADAPGTNTTTHARVVPGFLEATAPESTITEIEWFGGMKPLGTKQIGVEAMSGFDLTLVNLDEITRALINASSVDVSTYSESAISAPNSNRASPPQVMLSLTTSARELDGSDDYLHLLYHNVQMRARNLAINSNSGRNPMNDSFRVTPSQATRTMLGLNFSSLAVSVEDNSDYYIMLRTKNRIAFTTYVANGSATTFILGYRPIGSDATGAGKNRISKNGAIQTVNSVNTSTGVVTLSAAGSSGDIYVVCFETNYTAI